ncbi:36871_t:CDS:2, partial [Racocetra persica]
DYIEYILNNPTIAPNLYFVCDEKYEFWYSTLWQDSSLFGETKLCVNNVTYQAGNFLRYHQDKAIKFACIHSIVEVNKRQLLRADLLVLYSELSRHLCSMNKKAYRMNIEELWLVEEQEYLIISENITQINVWLKDLERPVEYEYFVFLNIYFDNFGKFCNSYHSLGGVYLVIGNMPLDLRKLLKNHFLLGFVLFGVSFIDFIKPILDNIHQLQSRKIINTLEGEIWLIGRLGCITANLSQGNNLADRHLQSSQDAYYTLAGKATHLLDITLKYLNTNRNFTFSDTLRLAILIPFILRYFLSPLHLKAEIIEHLKNVYKLTCNDYTIIKLIELWVVEAKLLKLAFSTTMTNDTYKKLRGLFKKEQIGFLKIFPDIFENLPNVHINIYLPQHACTFATLVNTSVGVKEI